MMPERSIEFERAEIVERIAALTPEQLEQLLKRLPEILKDKIRKQDM